MQIDINGVLTKYEIINPDQQDTLVILHGWGSSLLFWLPVAELLSKNFRVILVDLPGFGDSQPLSGNPDISDYTNFVRDFAHKLGLEPFILAGHSFGGQITLDYALKYAEDLKSIILIAPAIIKEKKDVVKIKVQMADALKPLLSNAPTDKFEHSLGLITPRDYQNANDYQRKVLHKIVDYSLLPFLSQITIPVDIIWGQLDIVTPNIGDFLIKHLPHSCLHQIPSATHLLNLTHQKELVKIINQIIEHKNQ